MSTAGLTSLGLLLCLATGTSQAEEYSRKEADRFAKHLRHGIVQIAEAHIAAPNEGQMIRWAVRGLYEALNEPLPAELRRRLQRVEKADGKEKVRLLSDARLRLGGRADLQEHNDFKLCFQAIFVQVEPGAEQQDRSSYLFVKDFGCQLTGVFSEVGLRLVRDPATDLLRVVTPILHGPGYKAGIRAGDLITEIWTGSDLHGRPQPMAPVYSTKGMSVEDAYRLLLGREGTEVILTVIPAAPRGASKTR